MKELRQHPTELDFTRASLGTSAVLFALGAVAIVLHIASWMHPALQDTTENELSSRTSCRDNPIPAAMGTTGLFIGCQLVLLFPMCLPFCCPCLPGRPCGRRTPQHRLSALAGGREDVDESDDELWWDPTDEREQKLHEDFVRLQWASRRGRRAAVGAESSDETAAEPGFGWDEGGSGYGPTRRRMRKFRGEERTIQRLRYTAPRGDYVPALPNSEWPAMHRGGE